MGRFTTMPNAPRSLCSQTKVRVREKFGSAMAGMAIRKCRVRLIVCIDNPMHILAFPPCPRKMKPYPAALFWFRRDLRLEDNAGLYYALTSARQVHCVFVFDREILEALPTRSDRRVEFIHASVTQLREALRSHGGELHVLHDRAREAIPRLAAELGVDAVFANEDYEPEAIARDDAVAATLAAAGRRMHRAKDQAVFDKDEVLTRAGEPFSVFTPYKNAWLEKVDEFFLRAYPVEKHAAALARPAHPVSMPALEALGFEPTNLLTVGVVPGMTGARSLLADFEPRMADYHKARD